MLELNNYGHSSKVMFANAVCAYPAVQNWDTTAVVAEADWASNTFLSSDDSGSITEQQGVTPTACASANIRGRYDDAENFKTDHLDVVCVSTFKMN